MKLRTTTKLKLLTIFTFLIITPILQSWGSYGHERINRSAVLSLPTPIVKFYYNHIDFITQGSSVPDLRRNLIDDTWEDSRHYFDLENFGNPDSIPSTLSEAKKKYGEEFLKKNGILPWHIQELMSKLTKAFKEKRKMEILFLSTEIGHYVGDAHTPLHTTVNYDGQLTGQDGIHSAWESRIPKLHGENYNYYSGQAKFIENIEQEVWKTISESNKLVNVLLTADKSLREQFSNTSGDVYKNDEYIAKYNQMIDGMVEKQIVLASQAAASFWYTAWVNAGKPDLGNLDPKDQTERNKRNLARELKLFKKGTLVNIKS